MLTCSSLLDLEHVITTRQTGGQTHSIFSHFTLKLTGPKIDARNLRLKMDERFPCQTLIKYKHSGKTDICGYPLLEGQKCWSTNCCATCHNYDRELLGKIDCGKGITDDIHRRWATHMAEYHGIGKPKAKATGNGKHKGLFAYTLTMSPTDGLTADELLAAARKVMSQQSCPVKRYAWYLEYKDEGRHPHIHGVYETESGGRIESKYWKRAWPIWNENKKLGLGHRGGYHRPVTNEFDYSAYISKDNGLSESKGF